MSSLFIVDSVYKFKSVLRDGNRTSGYLHTLNSGSILNTWYHFRGFRNVSSSHRRTKRIDEIIPRDSHDGNSFGIHTNVKNKKKNVKWVKGKPEDTSTYSTEYRESRVRSVNTNIRDNNINDINNNTINTTRCISFQSMYTSFEKISRRISLAGILSRSDAEMDIFNGHVYVDGHMVNQDMDVSDHSVVHHKGVIVEAPGLPKLWIFRKPRGVVCSASSSNQKGVYHLPELFNRWDSDRESLVSRFNAQHGILPPHFIVVNKIPTMADGVVLLTNDGIFAHNLQHPGSKLLTNYRLKFSGSIPDDCFKSWRRSSGVLHRGLNYGPIFINFLSLTSESSGWIDVKYLAGKAKDIGCLFWEKCRIRVSRMKSFAFGPYTCSRTTHGFVRPMPIDDFIWHLKPKREPMQVLVPTSCNLKLGVGGFIPLPYETQLEVLSGLSRVQNKIPAIPVKRIGNK